MFSVRLSIAAEMIKLSVNSSVFLLTRYDTDWRALSKLSFKSFSTLIAVSKSILMENVEDNKTENTKNSSIVLKFAINNTANKTSATNIAENKTRRKPDILLRILINSPLKKLIADPIITTGCILAGSSPKMTSIAIDDIKMNIININKLISPVWKKIISLNISLYSIILYYIYDKKIYNLLLNFYDDIMDIEEKIRTWLMEEDALLEKKFDDNAEFHYIIEFPKENIMDVVKPREKNCVIIACATQVAQEHMNLMKSSTPENRREFILDLQFGINSYLVDFDLNINKDLLQQFVVTDTIFEDGLTKQEFMKTIKRVFKAKLHCIFLIDKRFGGISPKVNVSNENDMFV